MRTFKRMASLCLMLLLLLSFPAAMIVSAAELDTGQEASAQASNITSLSDDLVYPDYSEANSTDSGDDSGIMLTDSGSSGSLVGGGGSGGGSSTWSGSANFISPGVTFEVITAPYGTAYDRTTTYDVVIQYLESNSGIFGGALASQNTFILDTTDHPTYGGSLIRLSINSDGSTNSVITGYLNSGDSTGYALYYNCANNTEPSASVTTSTRNPFVWTETSKSYVTDFIKQIITGTNILDYHPGYYTTTWDIDDVEDEDSTYAQMLKVLGVSDELIQNYLDAYNGKLSRTADADAQIPIIIWAAVAMETHASVDGTKGWVYSAIDASVYGDSWPESTFLTNMWNKAYTSESVALAAYKSIHSANYAHNSNTYICKSIFGNHYVSSSGTFTYTNWDPGLDGSSDIHNGYAVAGSGWVNRIQADGVDATEEDGTNTFYFFRGYWAPYGSKDATTVQTRQIQIAKTANCSCAVQSEISGNTLYSLAGAEYEVYASDGTYMETLTTGSDGTATSSLTYAVGFDGYLVETVAPPGYKLSSDPIKFVIETGDGVQTISVTDVPVFDPVRVSLQKIDASTGTAQGDSSFVNAIFKVEYYTNYTWSGTAERTWYFRTDSNGYWAYNTGYIEQEMTVDALYVGGNGGYNLPLGSVKITEISSSTGYTVLSSPLYYTITQNTSGGVATGAWTTESLQYLAALGSGQYAVYEPVDTDSYGSVIVYKEDYVAGGTAQGAATLEGAEFQIINKSANAVTVNGVVYQPDEVCLTLTTDANGYAASGDVLPIGTYQIKESKAPEGYSLSSTTETFSITSSVSSFTWTCKDRIAVGGIQIIKQSSVELDNTDANAGLEGITFSVINNNDQSVYIGGVEYQPGEVCCIMELQWFQSVNWSGWIAIEEDWFPYGDYIVRENVSENVDGNDLANPYYLACSDDIYVTIDEDGVTLEFTIVDELLAGEIDIYKTSALDTELSGAKFLLEWSTDGITWEPVFYSATLTQGGCSTCDADGCVTSDGSGNAVFDGLDPRLYYRVTEIEAPQGYQLLTEPAWEGMITTDTTNVYLCEQLTVYNSPGYTLPATGEWAFLLIALGGFGLALAAALVLLSAMGKERQDKGSSGGDIPDAVYIDRNTPKSKIQNYTEETKND